jgi:hypothetical protein
MSDNAGCRHHLSVPLSVCLCVSEVILAVHFLSDRQTDWQSDRQTGWLAGRQQHSHVEAGPAGQRGWPSAS